MNWKRTARWSWLILPFLLLAVWPGVAAAQSGVAAGTNALLYEVTENLKLNPLLHGRGISTAALMGTANALTSICPAASPCGLTAMASRNINLATGTGPVTGTFSVVGELPGGGSNPVDGPELVILRGTLHGTINLGPALLYGATGGLAGAPIGTISGRWSAKGVAGGPFAGLQAHGTFTGTFRLPFVGFPLGCLADGNPSDCTSLAVSYFTDAGGRVDVQATELSLAEPTVRLEVQFVAD